MSQQTTRPVVGGGNGLKACPCRCAGRSRADSASTVPTAASGAAWCCAPEGTPVKAVAPGTVVYAEWLRGFGNLIIVDHGQQYLTVYAYNQSLLKRVGDPVGGGDTIALVGATGGRGIRPTEIRHRGAPVDPAQWLAQ